MTSRKPSRFILATLLFLAAFTAFLPSISSSAVLTGYKGMRWVGNPNQGAYATDSPLTYATFEEAYAYTAAHANDPLTPTTGS